MTPWVAVQTRLSPYAARRGILWKKKRPSGQPREHIRHSRDCFARAAEAKCKTIQASLCALSGLAPETIKRR
jgi:hypothetical protein